MDRVGGKLLKAVGVFMWTVGRVSGYERMLVSAWFPVNVGFIQGCDVFMVV